MDKCSFLLFSMNKKNASMEALQVVLYGLGSDHLPLLEVHRLTKSAGRLRWAWEKADWPAFTQAVEKNIKMQIWFCSI